MTAEEYLALWASMPTRQDRTDAQEATIRAVHAGLSAEEKHRARRLPLEAYFVPENIRTDRPPWEEVSPSGRYRLVVTTYRTGTGSWDYTRGQVFRIADNVLLADVKRNYHDFPCLWIENHPTGTDLMVTGEDYQGQTVVDLRTGNRRDVLPPEAEKGHGFCWASVRASGDKSVLVVHGCYWACPYEYRIYDFSDPLGPRGWPELRPDSGPDLDGDGETTCDVAGDTVTWTLSDRVFRETGERYSEVDRKLGDAYDARRKAETSGASAEEVAALKAAEDAINVRYDDDRDDLWTTVVDHRAVFRLAGGKIVLVEEAKSDHLVERERQWAEYRDQEQARMRAWMDGDEFHRNLPACGKTSFWYPSMDARNQGEKNPAFFSVAVSPYVENRRRVGSVTWGVAEGPVMAALWTYGKGEDRSRAFPRTTDGFRKAWAAAVAHEKEDIHVP